MKERNLLIANYITFFLISFLVAGFQTSFWPSVFRFFYGTQVWIYIAIYFYIYRSFGNSLVFAYINSLVLYSFSNIPFGLLLSMHLILLISCNFLRKRIFWNTTSYFMMVSAAFIVFYDFIFLLLSGFFEYIPAQSPTWRSTFLSLVLSPLFSMIFFHIGRLADHVFPPPQSGSTET